MLLRMPGALKADIAYLAARDGESWNRTAVQLLQRAVRVEQRLEQIAKGAD